LTGGIDKHIIISNSVIIKVTLLLQHYVLKGGEIMTSTVFSDFIVNSTDLRKNQKYWLKKAYENPITVSYGHRQLAIMNRQQIGKLYTEKHYTELVLKACQEFVKGLRSETFPWVEYLDEEEKIEFHKELLTCIMNSIITDNWIQLEHLIEDWKATAEVASNPEISRMLQDKATPEEYVTLK